MAKADEDDSVLRAQEGGEGQKSAYMIELSPRLFEDR